jgi:hypothetical protein
LKNQPQGGFSRVAMGDYIKNINFWKRRGGMIISVFIVDRNPTFS